jgi:hypothetical protein
MNKSTLQDQILFPFTHSSYLLEDNCDRPDDGGSMHFWNVSLLQWDYMALHSRRL